MSNKIFAVKKKPFYLMAKTIGSVCNLDCTYCYYLDKAKLYPEKSNTLMTDEVLHQYVKNYVESQIGDEVLFTWHGGEPMLRKISFYEKVVEYQQIYSKKYSIRIVNSLQANGTLINEEWCEFFKKHKFLIGLSIDGPAELHDAYRKDRRGNNTFEQVHAGLKLLQKYGIEYNILAVVNNINVKKPREVYQYFKDSGAHYIQFTPIVERIITTASPDELLFASVDIKENVQLTDWSVNPKEYGEFLCTIFDEWVKTDVGTRFVINFDAMLANWVGVEPPICTASKTCGHALAMEYNGDIYACDHFVFPEYKLGNIMNQSLSHMVYSTEQLKFGQSKQDTLPKQCKECEYLFACNGECPKNRISTTWDGEGGLNYLCEGFKIFYKHIDPYMKFMANEIKIGGAPSKVMSKFKS